MFLGKMFVFMIATGATSNTMTEKQLLTARKIVRGCSEVVSMSIVGSPG